MRAIIKGKIIDFVPFFNAYLAEDGGLVITIVNLSEQVFQKRRIG